MAFKGTLNRLRFSFLFNKNDHFRVWDEQRAVIGRAAVATMRELAEQVKQEGRANIAAAGFGPRWRNTWRADVYPKTGFSINAAAYFHHKIPYSGIFERDSEVSPTIHPRGAGLLWIPTQFAPKRAGGGRRMTPKSFPGKLFPIRNKKGHIVLMARVAINRRAANRRTTLKGLRSNRQKLLSGERGIESRALPMFTGLPSVTLRKRFNLLAIVQRARSRMAALFAANLKG